MARFAEYARDELFDSTLYGEMAKRAKSEKNRKILEEMSKQELWHYKFWSKYSGPVKLDTVDKLRLKFYLLMSRLLGTVFTVKFLERHEEEVLQEYKRILENREVKDEDIELLEKVIRDEEEHEQYFVSQIDEFSVRYLGSIALGMADAIIELIGVQAGFIGYTSSTVITAIASLIVGVSASMSMAAAAYLQAKQEAGKKPLFSAATTGLAYILTVLALTTPFFLDIGLLYALASSLLTAILILGVFSYYSSVIFGGSFLRDYLENVGLILLVVFIGNVFGMFVKQVFGNIPI